MRHSSSAVLLTLFLKELALPLSRLTRHIQAVRSVWMTLHTLDYEVLASPAFVPLEALVLVSSLLVWHFVRL